jgi:hypothetical protein
MRFTLGFVAGVFVGPPLLAMTESIFGISVRDKFVEMVGTTADRLNDYYINNRTQENNQ